MKRLLLGVLAVSVPPAFVVGWLTLHAASLSRDWDAPPPPAVSPQGAPEARDLPPTITGYLRHPVWLGQEHGRSEVDVEFTCQDDLCGPYQRSGDVARIYASCPVNYSEQEMSGKTVRRIGIGCGLYSYETSVSSLDALGLRPKLAVPSDKLLTFSLNQGATP
jgi:hypothetical protein